MQFIKPDDRPASAQQHTYSLWVRLLGYWCITLLFFPLGMYLMGKDLEVNDHPLWTIGTLLLGLVVLGAVVALVKALVH